MPASIILLPSARRLINSLRDIGYDLPTAVADLVDNSIAADSKEVDVDFQFDGADSWIRISDDGFGMSPTVLDEAMRYGTQRSYEHSDLGRFGLGLKTASLSQCRRLTVATRQGLVRRRIAIRQWDLERIARRNKWELVSLRVDEVSDVVVAPLVERPGTVVVWEGLDRILGYRLPDGAVAKRALDNAVMEVRDHLAMVFHRFLSGEAGRRLTIRVNGEVLDPWDPYMREELHTVAIGRQDLHLQVEMGHVRIAVQPYILPSQHQFSSAAAHARAAGPNRWNRQQGFYFYRNHRLLQAGGWNRLRTPDEHTKLARIAVDIPAEHTDAFRVNVAKMTIVVPAELRNQLAAIASGVASRAAGAYRQRLSETRPDPSAPHSVPDLPTSRGALVSQVTTILREELSGQPALLRRILTRLAAPEASTTAISRADAVDPPADGIFVIRRQRHPARARARRKASPPQ